MCVVRSKLGCKNDLSEVYSVPRVSEVAAELGMLQGFSLDLSAPTPSGYVWNFWKRECRERALHLVRTLRPYVLIGSPECRIWCLLQNLAASKSPEAKAKLEKERNKYEVHMRFCSILRELP